MSFKSHVMSSSTTVIERLRHVKTSLVAIHPDDAAKMGEHGDWLGSPHRGHAEAQVSVLDGVMPGCLRLSMAMGIPRWEQKQHYLDGQPMPMNAANGSGINLTLGLLTQHVKLLTRG